jgi:predicted phage baseplate assembly protein
VEDFFDSKPDSRYYVVERATGEVVFGDGVCGMIPSIGRDNIKATYQVGGGRSGNVGASEIVALKTSIPFVGGVTNPEAAEGGSDTEHRDAVFERGSHLIKHRNRAVTEEDFERLARAASGYIARTKCYIKDGTLKIIVIPGRYVEDHCDSWWRGR